MNLRNQTVVELVLFTYDETQEDFFSCTGDCKPEKNHSLVKPRSNNFSNNYQHEHEFKINYLGCNKLQSNVLFENISTKKEGVLSTEMHNDVASSILTSILPNEMDAYENKRKYKKRWFDFFRRRKLFQNSKPLADKCIKNFEKTVNISGKEKVVNSNFLKTTTLLSLEKQDLQCHTKAQESESPVKEKQVFNSFSPKKIQCVSSDTSVNVATQQQTESDYEQLDSIIEQQFEQINKWVTDGLAYNGNKSDTISTHSEINNELESMNNINNKNDKDAQNARKAKIRQLLQSKDICISQNNGRKETTFNRKRIAPSPPMSHKIKKSGIIMKTEDLNDKNTTLANELDLFTKKKDGKKPADWYEGQEDNKSNYECSNTQFSVGNEIRSSGKGVKIFTGAALFDQVNNKIICYQPVPEAEILADESKHPPISKTNESCQSMTDHNADESDGLVDQQVFRHKRIKELLKKAASLENENQVKQFEYNASNISDESVLSDQQNITASFVSPISDFDISNTSNQEISGKYDVFEDGLDKNDYNLKKTRLHSPNMGGSAKVLKPPSKTEESFVNKGFMNDIEHIQELYRHRLPWSDPSIPEILQYLSCGAMQSSSRLLDEVNNSLARQFKNVSEEEVSNVSNRKKGEITNNTVMGKDPYMEMVDKLNPSKKVNDDCREMGEIIRTVMDQPCALSSKMSKPEGSRKQDYVTTTSKQIENGIETGSSIPVSSKKITFYWVPQDYKDFLHITDHPIASDYFPSKKDVASDGVPYEARFCAILVREFFHVNIYLRLHPEASHDVYAIYNVVVWGQDKQPVGQFKTPVPIPFLPGTAHHVASLSDTTMLDILNQNYMTVVVYLTYFPRNYIRSHLNAVKKTPGWQELMVYGEPMAELINASEGNKTKRHTGFLPREDTSRDNPLYNLTAFSHIPLLDRGGPGVGYQTGWKRQPSDCWNTCNRHSEPPKPWYPLMDDQRGHHHHRGGHHIHDHGPVHHNTSNVNMSAQVNDNHNLNPHYISSPRTSCIPPSQYPRSAYGVDPEIHDQDRNYNPYFHDELDKTIPEILADRKWTSAVGGKREAVNYRKNYLEDDGEMNFILETGREIGVDLLGTKAYDEGGKLKENKASTKNG